MMPCASERSGARERTLPVATARATKFSICETSSFSPSASIRSIRSRLAARSSVMSRNASAMGSSLLHLPDGKFGYHEIDAARDGVEFIALFQEKSVCFGKLLAGDLPDLVELHRHLVRLVGL